MYQQFVKDVHVHIMFLIGRLSKIYLNGRPGFKFAKLFDEIAELFPKEKTRRLKDFIQSKFKLLYKQYYDVTI